MITSLNFYNIHLVDLLKILVEKTDTLMGVAVIPYGSVMFNGKEFPFERCQSYMSNEVSFTNYGIQIRSSMEHNL